MRHKIALACTYLLLHLALSCAAPSIVEVNAKRLEAQKRAATPKKALGPVGVNGANVAPIPMAPTTGPTKEKEGAARPATAPPSAAHTGGGGHSATAAPPKKKFNLQVWPSKWQGVARVACVCDLFSPFPRASTPYPPLHPLAMSPEGLWEGAR
jgi:hypothetical protein